MSYALRRRLKKRYREELVKRGRRTYGAIYTRPSGERFYLAFRTKGGLFRDGEKSDSAAFREGKAMWAIDYDTLTVLRLKGVKVVGILDHQSEDIWLTTLWKFLNVNLASPRDYRDRGGSMQRFLPTHFFRRKLGAVKIR